MRQITYILSSYIFFLSLFNFSSCSQINKEKSLNESAKNKPLYNIKIITIADTAFGYQIFKNNKLYIKQLYIPAIAGNQLFKTKHQAQKVANLVLKKLNNNEVPPTISIKELDSLQINTKK